MKTYMAKQNAVERKWFLVDAAGMPVGRLASQVAEILTGKNKTIFTPHVDTGDFVVVINSDKVVFTGNKLEQKKYRYHTGYVGGLKEITAEGLMAKDSRQVIEKAVKGMLPKTSLGRKQITRLHVYKDENHMQQAQNPQTISLKGGRN